MEKKPDTDLVKLACSGDREAFSYLVERYGSAARRLAARIVHCEELAADLT